MPDPSQRRLVTVHRVADRHADLHERDFAGTQTVTVSSGTLSEAVLDALSVLDLAADTGKVVITVDWPHDAA